MKPFAVVPFKADKIVDGYFSGTRGRDMLFYYWRDKDADDPHPAYFDSLEGADAYAQQQAKNNPGVSYAVVSATVVYSSTPGPVTKSVYSEDGLLPE